MSSALPNAIMLSPDPTEPATSIAVVDDDVSVRRSLTNLFDSLGFMVASFESAEAFLASDSSTTGCLILDVELPGMSGLELLERLSRREAGFGVVMLTAHGDQQMRRRAVDLGADAFLSKPFRSDELVQSVKRRLGSADLTAR